MNSLSLRIVILLFAGLILGTMPSRAQLLVDSPTTSWTAVSYSGIDPDYSNDEQASGLDLDLVGNASSPSFYKAFWDGGTSVDVTDGEIGFRARLAGDKSPAGFKGALYVGIDVTGDGSLDLFVGAVDQGSVAEVGIWSAGSGSNTSPNTTTIASVPVYSVAISSSNYNWSPVDNTIDPGVSNTNIDNGSGGSGNHTDHFLSFVIPFNQLVEASKAYVPGGIDQNSLLNFVVATSTQANSMNSDLNGLPLNFDGSASWVALNATTQTYTASSVVPVPEPGGSALVLVGGMLVYLTVRCRGRFGR